MSVLIRLKCRLLLFSQTHKSFTTIRNRLKNDVDRMAKSRQHIRTASASSLSSTDQNTNTPPRPFSALRPKRRGDAILRKFVQNDINEDELKDKMQKAQQALDSHRESIKELLKKTAHAPSQTIPKIKYQPIPEDAAENDWTDSTNRYNKMPNVTTRRVVFVNLDEDS